MATLVASPDPVRVGQQISFTGEDYTPAAVVTITVPMLGVSGEVVADASGTIGTDDPADAAVATLTLAGNAIAAETVVIGAVTYTWRASVATTANEVLVGATASASLDNLKAAIGLEAGAGTLYGSATVIHPTVEVVNKTATTLVLAAKTGGTGGNALASTETMTQGSFGGATFSGGSAATGVSPMLWMPDRAGKFKVTASDGTNEATTYITVWASS